MITRAQAEALLTLAESLEVCTELGIEIREDEEGAWVDVGGDLWFADPKSRINGMTIRLAVNAMVPKRSI